MFRTLLTAAALSLVPSLTAAAPTVTFELCQVVVQPGEAQKWSATLSGQGIRGFQIRSATAADRPKIDTQGQGAAVRYKVVGIIARSGQLTLPGLRIRSGDGASLGRWIRTLQEQGPDAASGKPVEKLPYDLSASELDEIYHELARKVDFETAGQSCADIYNQLSKKLSLPIQTPANLAKQLAEGGEAPEELKGVALGTALAYVLRPAGLAFQPSGKSQGGPLRLVVVPSVQAESAWPVGLPLKKTERETLPKLLEVLETEIDAVALSDVLASIQPRLAVPMLIDRVSLAKKRIELSEVIVDIKPGKLTYQRLLSQSLAKGRLKFQLRIDEADQPLVWVTVQVQ